LCGELVRISTLGYGSRFGDRFGRRRRCERFHIPFERLNDMSRGVSDAFAKVMIRMSHVLPPREILCVDGAVDYASLPRRRRERASCASAAS